MTDSQKSELEKLAGNYTQLGSPFEQVVRRACVDTFRPLLPASPSVLELGCADGYMTSLIQEISARHAVVDASTEFIAQTKLRVGEHVEFYNSLFEDFEPTEKYDAIVMCYILEHIPEPHLLLKRARTWLKDDRSFIFAAVPNSRALSRQLGRALGVLESLYEVTPVEQEHGHYRSYDRVMLDRDFEGGNISIFQRGGLVLKPFSTAQMDEMISHEIIGDPHYKALSALGDEYPDLCHTIYTIGR